MRRDPQNWIEQIDPVRVKAIFRDIKVAFDFTYCDELKDKYKINEPAGDVKKYLDYEKHVQVNIRRALALGLDVSDRKYILDIGTGAGYFPLVCEFFGHDCVATDMSEKNVYRELVCHFGINRVIAPVRAMQELPKLGHRFDIVTAFAVAFSHNPRTGDHWGAKEWQFLLDDLVHNQMSENGIAWFHLNPSFPGGARYDSDLLDFFTRSVAFVRGPHVVAWANSLGKRGQFEEAAGADLDAAARPPLRPPAR